MARIAYLASSAREMTLADATQHPTGLARRSCVSGARAHGTADGISSPTSQVRIELLAAGLHEVDNEAAP